MNWPLLLVFLISAQLVALSHESSFFRFVFGGSKSKLSNNKSKRSPSPTVKMENVYANGFEEDQDRDWLVCDEEGTFQDASNYYIQSAYISEIRRVILNSLVDEQAISECVTRIGRMDRSVQASHARISAHVKLFEEMLLKPSDPNVPDAILAKYFLYITNRLRDRPAEVTQTVSQNLQRLVESIFLQARGREFCTIAIRGLQTCSIQTCFFCDSLYGLVLNTLSEAYRRYPVYSGKLLDTFYVLLEECSISNYNPIPVEAFNSDQKYLNHYLLARTFRLLLFKDSPEEQLRLSRRLLPNGIANEQQFLLLNEHLKNSQFLVTLSLTQVQWSARKQLFYEILRQFTDDLLISELIPWLLERNLLNILEGVFVYLKTAVLALSDESIFKLWEMVLIGPAADLTKAALLLAYLPPSCMSRSQLDAFIMIWVASMNVQYDLLRNFRVLIMATESVASPKQSLILPPKGTNSALAPVSWPFPESLLNYFMSETEAVASKSPFLLLASRIYLARQFGIPFAETLMTNLPKAEACWTEVVASVNFFLDRIGTMRDLEVPRVC